MTIKAEDILASSLFGDEEGESPEDEKTDPGNAERARGADPTMPRPIILGVVGDSATGKTTLSRGLVRMLGEDNVTHVAADDYHRYDRRQRAEHGITPLHPDCNYIDIMERHFAELRAGQRDPQARLPAQGRHVRPAGVHEAQAVHRSSRACSATTPRRCATATTCACSSRRRRSCGARGRCSATARGAATRPTRCSRSSTAASRTPSSYIRPQQRWADIVVSFMPGKRGDQDHLDAEIVLRKGLVHPDLVGVRRGRPA